jgi:hypothetical protein
MGNGQAIRTGIDDLLSFVPSGDGAVIVEHFVRKDAFKITREAAEAMMKSLEAQNQEPEKQAKKQG